MGVREAMLSSLVRDKETLETAQVHYASHSNIPTIGVELLDLPTSSGMWQFDINQRVSRVDLIFAIV